MLVICPTQIPSLWFVRAKQQCFVIKRLHDILHCLQLFKIKIATREQNRIKKQQFYRVFLSTIIFFSLSLRFPASSPDFSALRIPFCRVFPGVAPIILHKLYGIHINGMILLRLIKFTNDHYSLIWAWHGLWITNRTDSYWIICYAEITL